MRDAEGRGDEVPEDQHVDLAPRLLHFAGLLQEVGREGGAGDDVLRAFMHHHVRQMGHACAHHLETRAEREERGVFTHHEQMQGIAPLRRLLHQMAVAEGERIGVHHYRASFLPPFRIRLKVRQ